MFIKRSSPPQTGLSVVDVLNHSDTKWTFRELTEQINKVFFFFEPHVGAGIAQMWTLTDITVEINKKDNSRSQVFPKSVTGCTCKYFTQIRNMFM